MDGATMRVIPTQFDDMLSAARETLPRMTPDQYRQAIAAVGLNQEQSGQFFGRGRLAGQRWSLGRLQIPYAVQWSLEYMVAHKVTADPAADYMILPSAAERRSPDWKRPSRAKAKKR
jgi:hypothetical protein